MAYSNEITFGAPPTSWDRMVCLVHDAVGWPGDLSPPMRNWNNALSFDPPLPRPVPGKGTARWTVDMNGFRLEFFSSPQIDHFVDVYGQRILPTSRQLGACMGSTWVNQVWIARVPKPKWRERRKFCDYVKAHRAPFDELVASLV